MMAGTSPSIAVLPDGDYVVAFQTNTGVLGINTNGTVQSWADTELGMMAGTSPNHCALLISNRHYVVAGYLPGYATNRKRRYDIAEAPGDQLTHLIYCFAGFVQQGNVWVATTPEPKDETKNFNKLAALKQAFPSLNFMMSVGGWNNSQRKTNGGTVFSAIAADPTLRKAFVKSCLDRFILRNPLLFDGIDIDWEFPEPKDKANVTLLLQELRTQLNAAGRQQNRHFLSTMAIGVTAGSVDVSAVQTSLDWFNVMAYNFHEARANPQDDVTNFNAPLFGAPEDPSPGANIDQSIKWFIAAGVHPRKLVIGIPAYAHSYAGVDAANGGLYRSYSGPGPGTYTPTSGILTYKDVMDNYLPKCGPPAFDNFSKSSSMYCKQDRIWISPNMHGDVFAKAAYVIKNDLGGLMLWELGADKIDQFRLAEYMSTALHHTVA
jgi:chitinase